MARWQPSKTNHRQELVLREYLKTHNGTEAYQTVYKNTSRKVAGVLASRLLKKPHVKRRLVQLWERQMKRSDISVDKVLTDLQWAIEFGKKHARPDQVIAGANAQAKLVGLLRERVETGHVGEFGDTTSIEGILEVVSKEAGPEAAMMLASMFGLKVPESETTKQMKEAVLFMADPATDSVN